MSRRKGSGKGQVGVNKGTVYCECMAEVIKNPQSFCTCVNGMTWVANPPENFVCSDCRSGRHKS